MNPEPRRQSPVQTCGSSGPSPTAAGMTASKSIDAYARGYYGTTDAYPELLPRRESTDVRPPPGAANTASARASLVDGAIGRRSGDSLPMSTPLNVLDPEGRIVSRPLTPEGAEWESIATPVAPPRRVRQPHAFPIPTTWFRL